MSSYPGGLSGMKPPKKSKTNLMDSIGSHVANVLKYGSLNEPSDQELYGTKSLADHDVVPSRGYSDGQFTNPPAESFSDFAYTNAGRPSSPTDVVKQMGKRGGSK